MEIGFDDQDQQCRCDKLTDESNKRIFSEKIENFLDGPGDYEANRKIFGRENRSHNALCLKLAFASLILISLFFILFSHVDIAFSRLFYVDHHGFIMNHHPLGKFYSKWVIFLFQCGFVGVVICYLAGEIIKKPVLTLTRRRTYFVLLSILISAGLVTNVIFKSHWGRARPRDIREFEKTKIFSPAFIISNQCRKNCSFPSGDASFAFSFLCVILLVKRGRTKWFIIGTLGAGSVGLMRVARGGHFLSDVVIAGLLTVLLIFIFERLLLHQDELLEVQKVKILSDQED